MHLANLAADYWRSKNNANAGNAEESDAWLTKNGPRNCGPFQGILGSIWFVSYGWPAMGRSWIIIQLMPNRSRSWANRVAKNVSCIGMNTSPPSESAEKMRSASASLWTLRDR